MADIAFSLEFENDFLQFVADEKIALESRRYIGCKAKIADWILDLIAKNTNDVQTATDIFAGTGIVAQKMLELYPFVQVNDILHSNNIIYKAFFLDAPWSEVKIKQFLDKYNDLDAKNFEENYFSLNFGDKFFEKNVAKKIGFIREDIEKNKERLTEKEFAILLATLIYNIDKIANTLGHFEAYIKKPIPKTKLRLKMIDAKNFANAAIFQEDANLLAKKIKQDLVYIDPPYNSRQYCRFYHVYETLTKWDKPALSGIAMKPPCENMSLYCTSKAPSTFADLIESLDCKFLAVSYNNTYNSKSDSSKNKITLEKIEEILSKKGETKKFSKDYRFFNAGKTEFKNHQEILFITEVKK